MLLFCMQAEDIGLRERAWEIFIRLEDESVAFSYVTIREHLNIKFSAAALLWTT